MFQMLELGGSYIQKLNTISGEYIPDRSLTPYLLKPKLVITDPDGVFPTGDYTSYLVNVTWTVTSYMNGSGIKLSAGPDYTIDNSTKSLSLNRNVAVNEILRVEFSADFLDKTRSRTSHFTWSKDLTTQSETEYNLSLEVDRPSKLNLSPFKYQGSIPITATLKNGDEELAPTLCTYLWQKYDEDTSTWVNIDGNELWYVSGKNSKTLIVQQEYIQHVIVKVMACPKDNSVLIKSKSILLRRWYGNYLPDVYFSLGKYLDKDTKDIVIDFTVTNRQGIISNPEKYFDNELFYRKNKKSNFESIAYGSRARFPRDSTADDHQCGCLTRELSAFMPIELPDGTVLSDSDDKIIVAQFPTSTREAD
jgi:hypothetical protein